MSTPESTPDSIRARLFTDPSDPFAYSASPALRTIEWRYRDQIEWQLVMIGVSGPGAEHPLSTIEMAESTIELNRRYGMPFSFEAKARHATSARACQAVIAARLIHPGSEWRVLRALQLMEFNTPILIDEDDHLLAALESVPGLDPLRVVLAIDTPEVQSTYRAEWAESHSAAGSPSQLQGRTVDTPAGVRYGAPTIIFSRADRRLEVGGLQPVETYDLAVANLDPGLQRTGPPRDPVDALRLYPAGLTTQEVGAIMAPEFLAPDRAGTAAVLDELLFAGSVKRVPLGDDAIWLAG